MSNLKDEIAEIIDSLKVESVKAADRYEYQINPVVVELILQAIERRLPEDMPTDGNITYHNHWYGAGHNAALSDVRKELGL